MSPDPSPSAVPDNELDKPRRLKAQRELVQRFRQRLARTQKMLMRYA